MATVRDLMGHDPAIVDAGTTLDERAPVMDPLTGEQGHTGRAE